MKSRSDRDQWDRIYIYTSPLVSVASRQITLKKVDSRPFSFLFDAARLNDIFEILYSIYTIIRYMLVSRTILKFGYFYIYI